MKKDFKTFIRRFQGEEKARDHRNAQHGAQRYGG